MSEKIIHYKELKSIRDKHEKDIIVLCHGALDIIHPGHLIHFEEAKGLGDILVVTITGDNYILKKRGFSFTEGERAKQVAALEIVDYVSIIQEPSAVTGIENLKPDFYVKGSEFRDLLLDKTKNIFREKELVEIFGGQIYFTTGKRFSSTKIGHFLHDSPEAVQEKPFIKNHKVLFRDISKYGFKLEELKRFIIDANKLKVCVLGETIIDEWVYMKLQTISQKSRCMTGEEISSIKQIGAAGIIAKHLANFVNRVDLYTNYFPEENISNLQVFPLNRSHLVKTRFVNIENNVALFESKKLTVKDIDNIIFPNFNAYDVVLIADFGHGLLDADIINEKINNSRGTFVATMVQTNSSNYGFNLPFKYKNFNYCSMNRTEAELCLQKRNLSMDVLVEEVSKLIGFSSISVTDGDNGSYIKFDDNLFHMPTLSETIIDTIGCGDAYFAFSSLAVFLQNHSQFIALVGNIGAAAMAQKLCNESSISGEEFLTIGKIVI